MKTGITWKMKKKVLAGLAIVVALLCTACANTNKVKQDLVGTKWSGEAASGSGITANSSYVQIKFDRNNVVQVYWTYKGALLGTASGSFVGSYEIEKNKIYVYGEKGETSRVLEWKYDGGELKLKVLKEAESAYEIVLEKKE